MNEEQTFSEVISEVDELTIKKTELLDKLYEMSCRQAELALDDRINDAAITAINKAIKQIKINIEIYSDLENEARKRTHNAVVKNILSSNYRNTKLGQSNNKNPVVRIESAVYNRLVEIREDYKVTISEAIRILFAAYDELTNKKNAPNSDNSKAL